MRALLTRPRPDSEALAARLARLGIEALVEPLLTIHEIADAKLDPTGVQALVVTSANGARALGRVTGGDAAARALPVFAVGQASAEAARAAGFARVESAEGDVAALAALLRARLDPADGALLHAAGSVTAGNPAGELPGDLGGFEVRRAVLYRAEPAAALSGPAQAALAAGDLDVVLLYSPRTAATFARLVTAAGLSDACRGLAALCLSPAVAEALTGLDFRRVEVAPRPEEAALLALLGTGET